MQKSTTSNDDAPSGWIDLADIRWWNDSDRRIGQVTIHAWDKVTQQTLIPAVGTQYMEAHTEGGYIGATWPGRTDAAVYMEFRDADGRCWQRHSNGKLKRLHDNTITDLPDETQ